MRECEYFIRIELHLLAAQFDGQHQHAIFIPLQLRAFRCGNDVILACFCGILFTSFAYNHAPPSRSVRLECEAQGWPRILLVIKSVKGDLNFAKGIDEDIEEPASDSLLLELFSRQVR